MKRTGYVNIYKICDGRLSIPCAVIYNSYEQAEYAAQHENDIEKHVAIAKIEWDEKPLNKYNHE